MPPGVRQTWHRGQPSCEHFPLLNFRQTSGFGQCGVSGASRSDPGFLAWPAGGKRALSE